MLNCCLACFKLLCPWALSLLFSSQDGGSWVEQPTPRQHLSGRCSGGGREGHLTAGRGSSCEVSPFILGSLQRCYPHFRGEEADILKGWQVAGWYQSPGVQTRSPALCCHPPTPASLWLTAEPSAPGHLPDGATAASRPLPWLCWTCCSYMLGSLVSGAFQGQGATTKIPKMCCQLLHAFP